MGLACNLPDAPVQELQKLQVLDLSNNRISGPIPEFLPDSLAEVRMNNNNLIGAVPNSLSTHPNLKVLRLDYNQLELLPIEWTSIVYDAANSPFPLQSLNLGHNSLQVRLHTASCVLHTSLPSHNSITMQGSFPQGLAYFPLLQVLELQHNSLSGPITPEDSPGAFRQLDLLDVSDNTFSGNLPIWIRSVKTFITGTGNTFTAASDSNTDSSDATSSSGLSGGAIAGIVIGVLAGVACIIAAGVLVFIHRRRKPATQEPSNTYERYI
jgi:hypothetical protein